MTERKLPLFEELRPVVLGRVGPSAGDEQLEVLTGATFQSKQIDNHFWNKPDHP
jgi:hypothetical protein